MKREEEAIKKNAEQDEQASEAHLARHVTLARSVTLLQVAIAISAISIITKKRFMWFAGIVVAIAGIYFFITGLM